MEGDAGELKKIVLEIIQIPSDGLAIKAGTRIAHFVIQIAASFDLKARQHGHNCAISFHRLRSNGLAHTIFRDKLKERRVPQVFLKISAVLQILSIDFRHRQPVPAKMPGKFEEGNVLFEHTVLKANRGTFFADKPDDFTPRAAELVLQ